MLQCAECFQSAATLTWCPMTSQCKGVFFSARPCDTILCARIPRLRVITAYRNTTKRITSHRCHCNFHATWSEHLNPSRLLNGATLGRNCTPCESSSWPPVGCKAPPSESKSRHPLESHGLHDSSHFSPSRAILIQSVCPMRRPALST